MTGPQSPDPGAVSQVLLKLGEMSAQLAVIVEQLKAVPDHESRIRKLEQWRYGLPFAGLLAIASLAISAYGWLHK